MPLKACAYRKQGMMLLPRGIERYSVRPWCGWNQNKNILFYLAQVSDQRGTCLANETCKGWPVSVTAP